MTATSTIPPELRLPQAPFNLLQHALLVAKRGSEAHNTFVPDDDPHGVDDRDVLVVCVPPPPIVYGLDEKAQPRRWEQVQGINGVWDVAAYELRKFVHLLCKQNPNAIATLWLRPEDYYLLTPIGAELVGARHLFRSRELFYQATIGCARAHIHRMRSGEGDPSRGFMGSKRKALREKYGYDVKDAAHTIRLLEMGIEFLSTGTMQVYRPEESATRLRAIKRGEWPLTDVLARVDALFREADRAHAASSLPEQVDLASIDAWLIGAIHRQLSGAAGVTITEEEFAFFHRTQAELGDTLDEVDRLRAEIAKAKEQAAQMEAISRMKKASDDSKLDEIHAGILTLQERLAAAELAEGLLNDTATMLHQESKGWRFQVNTLAESLDMSERKRRALAYVLTHLRLPSEPEEWKSIIATGPAGELDAAFRDVECPAHKEGRSRWVFTPANERDRTALRISIAVLGDVRKTQIGIRFVTGQIWQKYADGSFGECRADCGEAHTHFQMQDGRPQELT